MTDKETVALEKIRKECANIKRSKRFIILTFVGTVCLVFTHIYFIRPHLSSHVNLIITYVLIFVALILGWLGKKKKSETITQSVEKSAELHLIAFILCFVLTIILYFGGKMTDILKLELSRNYLYLSLICTILTFIGWLKVNYQNWKAAKNRIKGHE